VAYHTPGRVHEVFGAVLEQPQPLRAEFLQRICAGDADLQNEVGHLLELYAGPEASAAHPDESSALSDSVVGHIVGSYRVLRLLGAGGMGQVYLGTRTDGTFDREVAIKIVPPGHEDASGDLTGRFEEECRILASLRHPSIATLFDAGHLSDGRLFIVMEYVDGVPITTYCNHHGLSNHDRLVVFEEVCAAVAAAHRHLIVHRDLKPANVLVDAAGRPKLLDFGIAKVLTAAGLEASPSTEPNLRRATPEYASPEQLRGAAASTGMDVFALGVILHEVLTGTRPKLRSCEATTKQDIGSYEEPSRVMLGVRDVARRSRALDRELDAIVLKALDLPPRRYVSVDALAADLRAYVTNHPVAALAGSSLYRAAKYVRRNRGLVLLALFAVVALLASAAGLVRAVRADSRERQAAVERLAAARALTESLFQVDQSLASATGSTIARERLARSVTDYLNRLKDGAGPDRGLRQDIASNYRRIGDIQGNPNGPNLGDRPRALVSYRAATDLLRGLAQERAESEVLFELGLTRAGVGDVLAAQGEPESARAAYTEAQSLAERLAREHPEEARYQSLVAGLHRSLGDLALSQGQPEVALPSFQHAAGIERALMGFGDSAERRRLRAVTYLRLGAAQTERGAWRDARREFAEGLQILRALAASGVPLSGVMRDTALALSRLSSAMQATDRRGAIDVLTQALDILRPLAQADPADARLQHDLLDSLVQYGDLVRAQDYDRARAVYLEARNIAESLNRRPLEDSQSARELAIVSERLSQDPVVGAPEFVLFAVVDGHRIPIPPDRQLPDEATQLALGARGPSGWFLYVIMFGAMGDATMLDEAELRRSSWTLPIAGPPPAETVLLLVVPHPLTDRQQRQLAMDIGSVSGPRAIDWDGQVIWNSDAGDRIVSRFTARGASMAWMRDVRSRLEQVHNIKFSGRTFAIRPAAK